MQIAIKESKGRYLPSDLSGDSHVLRTFDELLGLAARHGIQLLFYPHIKFWLERVEDAVRLCRKLGTPESRRGFLWLPLVCRRWEKP